MWFCLLSVVVNTRLGPVRKTTRPMTTQPPPNPFARPDPDEQPPAYYVLGGNHVGEAVARRLHDDGRDVAVITEGPTASDVRCIRGDPTELATLEAADVPDASTVVVAGRSDARNLLVAQLVRSNFEVPRVVVLTNDPDVLDPVDQAGHDPVCATTAIADAVHDEL